MLIAQRFLGAIGKFYTNRETGSGSKQQNREPRKQQFFGVGNLFTCVTRKLGTRTQPINFLTSYELEAARLHELRAQLGQHWNLSEQAPACESRTVQDWTPQRFKD
jgi:hypothetical protein